MGKKNSFILGTILGGTIAAATALLFAPKSGKALQKELSHQSEDLLEKAKEVKSKLWQQTHHLEKSVKKQVQDWSKEQDHPIKQINDEREKKEDFKQEEKDETEDIVLEMNDTFSDLNKEEQLEDKATEQKDKKETLLSDDIKEKSENFSSVVAKEIEDKFLTQTDEEK